MKKIILFGKHPERGTRMYKAIGGKAYTGYFSKHKLTNRPVIVEVAKSLGYEDFSKQLFNVIRACEGLPIITIYEGEITDNAPNNGEWNG